MKRYTAYSLILIGLLIRYLRHTENNSVKDVRKGIKDLLTDFERLGLNVSKSGAIKLEVFLDSLSSIDDNELLGNKLATELTKLMDTLESILFAEARTKHYYVTTDRRYNTKYLMEYPNKLFKNGVFGRLPELSQYDFTEGFKCIVFERSTAAAFHILRGTEGVLKDCYLINVKKKRVKTLMWGNMLKHLQERKKKKFPEILLEALDNIRRSYRNPTNHPEAVHSMDEAEDLLGLCIDVVNKMDKLR